MIHIYPARLFLRKQRLRLCNSIECPYAGQAPGRAHSSRWPSPEVPRLYGIANSLSVQLDSTVQLKDFRADRDASAETCKKIPMGSFLASRRRSKRAYTWTRLQTVEKSTLLSRTFSDSNPHTARTIRSKIVRVVSILFGYTFFRTGHGKVQLPTHICAV